MSVPHVLALYRRLLRPFQRSRPPFAYPDSGSQWRACLGLAFDGVCSAATWRLRLMSWTRVSSMPDAVHTSVS